MVLTHINFIEGLLINMLTIEINFHDPVMLQAAGIKVQSPIAIQALPGLVPLVGDVVTHADLSYPSGERARFRVVSRAHLFGGTAIQRLQLNVELVVLHQP
jgi:hypothetical protein